MIFVEVKGICLQGRQTLPLRTVIAKRKSCLLRRVLLTHPPLS